MNSVGRLLVAVVLAQCAAATVLGQAPEDPHRRRDDDCSTDSSILTMDPPLLRN